MSYYENGRPSQSLSTTKSQETLASLTLNVPLFAGFANTYKYQGAAAQIELATAQLQDVESQTLTEVVKAHADALAAQSNLRAAQALLDAAQAAMQSVQRKFDRGAADRAEMLSAESALVDAQSENTNARLALASATLKLFASAGGLSLALVH